MCATIVILCAFCQPYCTYVNGCRLRAVFSAIKDQQALLTFNNSPNPVHGIVVEQLAKNRCR
jgi:hypothetical protein